MIRATVTHRSRTQDYQRLVKARVTAGLDNAARDVQAEMLKLTSGTVSSAELAAMGHPFGRLPGRGRRLGAQRGTLPRLPINRQTGGLQDSLRIAKLKLADGQQRQLGFTDPNAGWVLYPGGTRKMVARGFWNELREQAKSPFRRAMITALRGISRP